MAEAKQMQHVIPLGKVVKRQFNRKAKTAVKLVRRFFEKHARGQQIKITSEVNHYLWQYGIEHVPRKMAVTGVPMDGYLYIYLKDSKQIDIDKKTLQAKTHQQKQESKDTSLPGAAVAEDEDIKKKKDEKKTLEQAADKLALKKG